MVTTTSSILRAILLLAISTTTAVITTPQVVLTTTTSGGGWMIGGTYTIAASFSLDSNTIQGYNPFLQLYLPTSCYDLQGAVSDYETHIEMPDPTITTFDSTSCTLDPVLSTILPDSGSCSTARKICGKVSHSSSNTCDCLVRVESNHQNRALPYPSSLNPP